MKDVFIKRSNLRRALVMMLVLAVAFTFSFFPVGNVAFAATGDDPTEAEQLTFGKTAVKTFPAYPDEVFTYHYYYYKFKTPSYGGANYTIKTTFKKGQGGNPGFTFYLLNEDYQQIDTDGSVHNHGFVLSGVGSVSSETYKNLKPNSTYYVEVESWWTNNDYEQTCTTCVNKKILKPAAPKYRSVTPGVKKITVKYNKVKYATKYQVQLKKYGGTWKTYNNGTKLTKTFYKLAKGKKYSVRVRAARKVNGTWYYGAWSAKKTVKVK